MNHDDLSDLLGAAIVLQITSTPQIRETLRKQFPSATASEVRDAFVDSLVRNLLVNALFQRSPDMTEAAALKICMANYPRFREVIDAFVGDSVTNAIAQN